MGAGVAAAPVPAELPVGQILSLLPGCFFDGLVVYQLLALPASVLLGRWGWTSARSCSPSLAEEEGGGDVGELHRHVSLLPISQGVRLLS